MGGIDFLIVLLVVVVILAALAQRISIPYPMVLLVGGIGAALLPGIPDIAIDPDLSLVIFLAPVLFQSAYRTSWRDFKTNAVPISMLAIGAVLVTMVAVGATSRLVFDGIPWAVTLTLGAIVSPPDAVAATSIFSRVGVPHRMLTILEGESLVNDASALIAYQFAVAAVVTGHFSMVEASVEFVLVGIGSVVFGLAVGWLLARLEPLIDDPSLEVAATLIAPLAIYVVADRGNGSGVLAVVSAGMYFGHYSSRALSPESRLGGKSVWETVLIVLNGLVFLLIGFEFVEISRGVPVRELAALTGKALILSAVVVLARFAWVLGSSAVYRAMHGQQRHDQEALAWRVAIAISWSGLRGIVSVASALALPLVLADGSAFGWRDDVIFITFVVIVVTLLGQGLTLPWLLRKLRIEPGHQIERETWRARRLAVEAALTKLDTLQNAPWVDQRHAAYMRLRYEHLLDVAPESGELSDEERGHMESGNRLRDAVLKAARGAVVAARDAGEIGDEARLEVEAELDLEDERMLL